MNHGDSIDLAHAEEFTLGRLAVRPSKRVIERDDGKLEVLEPRVMQVLVALARAGGAVVSRDDLVASCWGGRIVGDDAINRVISRLRRTAEGIGEGFFRIETVTKVGYRLASELPSTTAVSQLLPSENASLSSRSPFSTSRRAALLGSLAAGMAAIGGGLWLHDGQRGDPQSAQQVEADALIAQAELALRQSNREGQNQAVALLQRVIALAPQYAHGWGTLAMTYVEISRYRATAECQLLQQRGRSAAQKALSLEPENPRGLVALASARPLMGHWWPVEQVLRRATNLDPRDIMLLDVLATNLVSVGCALEAAAEYDRLADLQVSTPYTMSSHFRALWYANRMEDTDRLMAEAASLYPTHFANWFGRFYVLLYSGRPAQAIALAQDPTTRPTGIAPAEIERVIRVARAMQTRAPADIDAVMYEQLEMARLGTGYAENTIQFAAALGRIDDAFAVIDAYYFGRGFVVPEIRFSPEAEIYRAQNDRLTNFLFNPAIARMRDDKRFAKLTEELGLKRYWQESRSTPDYLLG